MGRGFRKAVLATSLILSTLPAMALAQGMTPDPIPEIAGPILGPVSGDHVLMQNGVAIPYRASWQEFPLEIDGTPQATISATSYVRKDVTDASERPVIFLFNGGPGASSSPLHFSAFGPRVRSPREAEAAPSAAPFPKAPPGYVDNPDSPLDVADLVFVDPVSTGFSRVLPGGSGTSFWSIDGDAAAMLSLIKEWLQANGREGSPVTLVGESYGGFRALTMMKDFGDLPINGVVLVSPAVDMSYLAGASQHDMNYVFTLPSMAAGAWYHQKVDRAGMSDLEFFEAASAFASSDYMAALYKGAALPEDEKRAVAQEMSRYIGLNPELLVESNLRPSIDQFASDLLKDENKTVPRLDLRDARPVRPPSREGRSMAANELGLGKTNYSTSDGIANYLAEMTGFPGGRDYYSLTLDVNFSWNWREETENTFSYYLPYRNMAAAMEANPELKVLVIGGIYDLAVPVEEVRYALRHSGAPADRVDFLIQPSGHSAFADDRPGVADRVRALATGAGK